MVAAAISKVIILLSGLLYPAYSSFKAVRRKSHREYTKWMMYWIVFALFQAVELVTDMFLTWIPLYYELKMVFVLWLVLPITEGSKQMYRLIVHPFLLKHEMKIDEGIAHAGKTGLDTMKKLSQAGLNKAATTVVTSAIMGQAVLTETLLRTQEGRQHQMTGGGGGGEDQNANAQSQDRQRRSLYDLEGYDVIEEEPKVTHRPESEETIWANSPSTDQESSDSHIYQQNDMETTHQT